MTHRFSKKHNVRLDQTSTRFAVSYRIGFDVFYEGIPVECGLAVNAMLICETSVCFDDTLRRDAGHSFESIDVLSITHLK